MVLGTTRPKDVNTVKTPYRLQRSRGEGEGEITWINNADIKNENRAIETNFYNQKDDAILKIHSRN